MPKKCSKEGCDYNVFSHGLCKYHQPRKEIRRSSLKRSQKPIKARAKPTGELELFKEIWNERPHKSELSGDSIKEFSHMCFHHMLTKQAYPEHRLNKENIILITEQEHRVIHGYPLSYLIERDQRWSIIENRIENVKEQSAKSNLF